MSVVDCAVKQIFSLFAYGLENSAKLLEQRINTHVRT